ncbi:MAG TPA: hypothetical protein VHD32_04145 [Candidatus Didemnitutus sp.]|nr:hypothetical protein [Candidatus Didemnitutus sp.]
MSLNKYEQGLFDYLDANPEERRHWQAKAISAALQAGEPGIASRALERDLWDYYNERSQHVAAFRQLNAGGIRRVSLQNLSEYLIRLFGPPVPKRKSAN